MNRPIILLFLILLFGTSATKASADAPASKTAGAHWDFAGWYGAGCYPNVAFDRKNQGRVYLTSDVAGIWRSDDRGEEWRFITKGLGNLRVSVIEVAPSDPTVLYAGTDAGVYVSQDTGATWKVTGNEGGKLRFSRPQSYRSLIISKMNPGSVIAGSSRGGVYYSEDFGESWELLGGRRPFSTLDAITVVAWVKGEEGVYAASSRGVARLSFEKDAEWEIFPNAPVPVTDLLVDAGPQHAMVAAGQKKLWVSLDGGTTWKAEGAEIPEGSLYRLLARPEGAILVGWNEGWKGGVVLTEDGGATWKKWEKKMTSDKKGDPTRIWASAHGRITALKADPFDSNIILRTDFWGVWRSEDGGMTWNEKIKGAPNTVTSDVAVGDDGAVYVATMDTGLLKSTDGGATYRCLFPKKGFTPDEHGHVWRVGVSGKRILATSSPWEADLVQVARSEDGGETFSKERAGLPQKKPKKNTVWEHGYPRAMAFHPSRPDTVYLGVDGDDGGGFFVSKDGGRNWRRPANQPGLLKIYNGLAVDPENPDRILWGASGPNNGGLYLSEDGGESWKLAANPMRKIFDVAFGSGGRAYAAGEDASDTPTLWTSADHGKNWVNMKRFDGHGSVEALCPLPDGRLAFGITRWSGEVPGHLYLASADGKDISSLDGDLPDGDGPAAIAYDPKSKTLYVARYAGSVYKTRLPGA